ncbi:MAG TPA: hypothetical protein VM939_05465 [Gemmatimonadaceae bacterium]|nr:hypothetical protein [Gemmatimonadaceae bacterium]
MSAESSGVTAVVARFLSTGAAALYAQLAEEGFVTISPELGQMALDAGDLLEEYGFAFRRNREWGYDLVASPVELLVPSLLYRLDWAYPPFGHLDPATHGVIRDTLERSLDAGTEALNEMPAKAQALVGAAQIDAFVVRMIGGSSILRALSAAEWSNNLPLVWSAITDGIQHGMQYRRVVAPLGLAAFGWQINQRDVHETGVDLRVSLGPPTSPFYLFADQADKLTAIVFVPRAHADAEPRATFMTLAHLTRQFLDVFTRIWDAAVPAIYVLDELRSRRTSFIDAAAAVGGSRSAECAAILFDRGIFAEINGEDEAVAPLLAHGLVRPSTYTIGLTPLVPNLVDIITDIVRDYGAST